MDGCVGKLKEEKMIRYKRDEWPYGRKDRGIQKWKDDGKVDSKWKGKKDEGKKFRKIEAKWVNRFLVR